MSDAPKRIYLQLDDEDRVEGWGGATWCVDRINDEDVEYVLAKSHASLLAQRDAMLGALNRIACHTDGDASDNYRADDSEGCLDTVHALAIAAIAQGE